MKFLAALTFLTAIPVRLKREPTPREVSGSLAYFPVIGLLIGIILAILAVAFRSVLPVSVSSMLLIVVMVLVTGAIHLDGLMDTFDGLAGHHPTEERWRIMRDSRVGAFGVIAATLVLLVKFAALASLARPWLFPSLVFLPVISRWAVVWAIFRYPYAHETGLGKAFKEGMNGKVLAVATLLMLGALVLIALVSGDIFLYLAGLAIIALGIWAGVLVFGAYLQAKFAGLTGDTYGAIVEVSEAGGLVIACLLAGAF